MTNNILSGDSTLPAASAGPASATAALLGDDVTEMPGDGSIDVLQKPKSSPLEKAAAAQHNHLCLPHTIKAPKQGMSLSDLTPLATPNSPCLSTPTSQRCGHRQSTCDNDKDSATGQKDDCPRLKPTDVGQAQVKRSKRYRVYVRNSMGTIHEVKVRTSDSVRRVKEKVSMTTDVFPQAMHMLFNGVELADEHVTMGMLGVVEGNTLHITPRLQSGQLEMIEGSQFNDESLYEKIMSHLSEQQVEELSSGRLHKPVSFVATFGGKRVLVRLKPAGDASTGSTSLCGGSSDTLEADPWTRGPTKVGGMRKDAQWRRERQIEHKNMRCCMDGVREKLRLAKTARVGGSTQARVDSRHLSVASSMSSPAQTPLTTNASDSDVASTKKARCQACSGRLGPIVFPCKCSNYYCAAHRHDHHCAYDYRNAQ